jgi:hypothetical protein
MIVVISLTSQKTHNVLLCHIHTLVLCIAKKYILHCKAQINTLRIGSAETFTPYYLGWWVPF